VHDEHVMHEVITYLRAQRPGLDRSQLIAEPVSSLTDLMQQMACVEIVVASRYHNVLCALKLAKPTLSVGYAAKFDALMAGAGLADFCQPARSVDLGRLIEQFTDLESRSAQLRQAIAERNAVIAGLLAHQFTTLSAHLFGAVELTLPACHKRVRTDAY